MSCGDLQLETCSKTSGLFISTYFTQPGQQLVNIGKLPPFCTLLINSVASSIIVRSSAKFVSNTFLNPNLLKPVTSKPVTSVPRGMLYSSPSEARTAGATCTMQYFFLL